MLLHYRVKTPYKRRQRSSPPLQAQFAGNISRAVSWDQIRWLYSISFDQTMRIRDAGIACSELTNVIYIRIILKKLFKELADSCSLDLFLFWFAFFSCSLILRPIILLCSRSLPLFAKHGRNSHHLPVYIATLGLSYKRYFFIIFGTALTFPALLLLKKESPLLHPLGQGHWRTSPKLL